MVVTVSANSEFVVEDNRLISYTGNTKNVVIPAEVNGEEIMLIDSLYDKIAITEALVISVVCAISLIMAKLVGCILPLLAKKIKLDPAVVASPLMTTIVDALALIIYCTIAIAVL